MNSFTTFENALTLGVRCAVQHKEVPPDAETK